MPSDADASAQSTPKKILVVEDNELNLKLLNDLLEFEGYTIITTRSGESAIELVSQHGPDLILLDIQLPDVAGTEVARRLKADEQTRSIPIIAVTAFAMPGDDAPILASGCDAYVTKPFNVRDFLDMVRDYLTGKR